MKNHILALLLGIIIVLLIVIAFLTLSGNNFLSPRAAGEDLMNTRKPIKLAPPTNPEESAELKLTREELASWMTLEEADKIHSSEDYTYYNPELLVFNEAGYPLVYRQRIEEASDEHSITIYFALNKKGEITALTCVRKPMSTSMYTA